MAFTADYLEKVVEPCDWLALWSTDVFDVLVEVRPTFRHVSVNIVNVALLSHCICLFLLQELLWEPTNNLAYLVFERRKQQQMSSSVVVPGTRKVLELSGGVCDAKRPSVGVGCV